MEGGSHLYTYPQNPNQAVDPMGLNPAVAIRIAVGIFSKGARTTEQAALPTVTVNGVSTVLLPGEDIFDAIRRQQIQDGYMLTESQCVRTDAEQKKADHENYHNNCEREPPDGLSPCELAKWKYRKEKKCYKLRAEWEQRWGNSYTRKIHEPHLLIVKNAMKNAAEQIKRNC